MPLTLRQIYYRLVAVYNYPNRRSSYNQLSTQLVRAREQREVDGSRIEDRTRGFLGGDGVWLDPEKFRNTVRKYFLEYWKKYRRKLWEDQDNFLIVWIEKDALSRVVSRAADKYRVIVAPSRGYASYSYIIKAITKLPRGKKTRVLHFADHDPSGLDMTRDLQTRLMRYNRKLVPVTRIALTYSQVDEYKLSPNPTKRSDTRSAGYIEKYGYECWELDAIEPRELQRLVVEAIEARLDKKQWEASLKQENEEKEHLEEIFDEWKRKIGEDEE